jgi:hypothetical protein
MGVLGAVLHRANGKIVPITPTSEERNALFASFVIGIEACENAIAEGRYLQALALLRQEMETLAQIKAVRAGKRNGTRCPNIAALGNSSLGRMYGELSEAAHASNHHMLRAATEYELTGAGLPGPTSGTRYFPTCDEGLARRSFTLHLGLSLQLLEELIIDLHERYNEEVTDGEAEAVNLAWRLMQAEGTVKLV